MASVIALLNAMFILASLSLYKCGLHALPKQILIDTDMDTDDLFAILYLLKQNRSEVNIKAITISANAWSNAGHAVNHLYDLLYMMGRDDIQVGIGGEGGILFDGTFLPDVGGYLSLAEQENSTAGGCRYRQAIPPGAGGQLDVDSNYGLRKDFLPRGKRHYSPLKQPTSQHVMMETLSSGPTIVLLIGSHTNFATFLMTNPELKKNVEHVFIMAGGVRSENPTGCCPKNDTSCIPEQCGDRGNLFTAYKSNPFAEFNLFADPFAAYQVFHSGLPITLVPLDATNTIPISREFFLAIEKEQNTYEAQYVSESLKLTHDTWFDDQYYTSYFMWDSFTSGILLSSIWNGYTNIEDNDFAELKYRYITIVTSNKPYGIHDGSNPFFDNRTMPKFHLRKGGVHSGHTQTGIQDPFCLVPNGKGNCMDGYTKEVAASEGVRVLVAEKAKPNKDINSALDREYFTSFLNALNSKQQTSKFNMKTEFPSYKESLFKPNLNGKLSGKPVILDLDMSPGDFVTLFYLLKMPLELIDIKAITIAANGWANAATIDIVYDILHMMGRDDIPVGLGEFFALGQAYPTFSSTGDCKYRKAISHGAGGYIDSDTLFGLARDLPCSPRRYTAHNSVKYAAPRDTEHPELRQPKAQEVLQNVMNELDSGRKATILTTGPLTNIATFLSSDTNSNSKIEKLYIVGGHVDDNEALDGGNVFTVPSNRKAEFNMYLDPLAAKQVLASKLNMTMIPLNVLRKASSFTRLLRELVQAKETPEAMFVHRLVSRMLRLHCSHHAYAHIDMFLGEVVGAAIMADQLQLNLVSQIRPVGVLANGEVDSDGWTIVDHKNGNPINVIEDIDSVAYYSHLSKVLNETKQSAVIASFSAQQKLWNTPPPRIDLQTVCIVSSSFYQNATLFSSIH